ncbi:protein ecdysoneless homolog isoform X2 [Patella vulgata]|uniref:protein ecdysoneless homolog isoform X2 n=1 Tax=Patella vulgata TaxID=6465 RepID=UPI00217F5E8D|nr:protein ecdysoneless homolog isoform X2 [Patella vulgata]
MHIVIIICLLNIALDVEPRMIDPDNQQMYGRIGEKIPLVFTYYYSFPAFIINFTRANSSGFKYEPGDVTWKDVNSVIDDDRLIFNNRSILGGGQISLIILNTTIQDYNAVYKCEVIFTNGKIVSAMIELILQSDTVMPETEKTTFERNMMIVLVIVMVLTSLIIGIVVCRYKCRSHKYERPRRASNTTNNMRHSYISINSVVIFHANRDSTTTNTESTASNDTDAYANPYDPINRDGIDTSKNFYMSLHNAGTSNINQGDDVHETEVDDNSVTKIDDDDDDDDDVTNIDDIHTADDDNDDDNDDDDDDDDT